jgi:hypothetical protein
MKITFCLKSMLRSHEKTHIIVSNGSSEYQYLVVGSGTGFGTSYKSSTIQILIQISEENRIQIKRKCFRIHNAEVIFEMK